MNASDHNSFGGTDTVLPVGENSSSALYAATRAIVLSWREAIVEDGDSDRRYIWQEMLAFPSTRELMIYKNAAAYTSWTDEGATPENKNTMIHLLTHNDELTIVVDDDLDPTMRAIINTIKRTLHHNVLLLEVA